MSGQLRAAAYGLFVILAVLAAAYVYGIGTMWEEMLARPVRVSYFIADVTVVFPAGLASGIGLLVGKRWAPPLFLVVLGALVFDTAHQVYYLFFDDYFRVPLVVAALLLAVVVAYAAFGWRAAFQHMENRNA